MRPAIPRVFSRTYQTLFRLALAVDPAAAFYALCWTLWGKRVRGWNRLCVAASRNPHCYRKWTEVAEPRRFDAYCAAGVKPGPRNRYHCLIFEGGSSRQVKATLDSVNVAFGGAAKIWGAASGVPKENLSSLLAAMQQGGSGVDWVLPLRAGDLLVPQAGKTLEYAVARRDDADIIYWDEDVRVRMVRSDPWFKPDWDPLLFAARDLLTGSCMVRLDLSIMASKTLADPAFDGAGIAVMLGLVVDMTEAGEPLHLPLILTHRASPPLSYSGVAAPEESHPAVSDFPKWRVVIPEKPTRWPMVSIIIPTRDRHELLESCMISLQKLDYFGTFEILIVDNDSATPESLALLERYRGNGVARIISFPGDFNFSALNNYAAQRASGAVLCLLNNDVEALDGNWLSMMVRHVIQEDVGAVGAQLLYPDKTAQHAGVVIGIGGAAGHFGRGLAADGARYVEWFGVTRRVSAVTAACLVVRRDRYLAVGGLDELAFAVAFNDVDFCLKLGRHGWRNVYVAQARLIHHESKSRGIDSTPLKSARFAQELSVLQERWQTADYQDPYFSPHFSRTSECCVLEFRT